MHIEDFQLRQIALEAARSDFQAGSAPHARIVLDRAKEYETYLLGRPSPKPTLRKKLRNK